MMVEASETTRKVRAARKPRSFDEVWQELAYKDLYTLQVHIVTGLALSTKIDPEDLNIDPSILDGFSGGYRARFSQKLKDARSKLSNSQKALYKEHTVYAGGFRFIEESSLPAAMADLEKMLDQADELRQEIIDAYDQELELYQETIRQNLEQAIPDDEPLRDDTIRNTLIRYTDAFPERDKFDQCLQVNLEGPNRLKNLAQSLKDDAQSTEESNRQLSAKLQAEQLKAKEKASELMLQSLGNALTIANQQASNEGLTIVAEYLDRVTARGAEKTTRDAAAIAALTDRLKTLAAHNPLLNPMVEAVGNMSTAIEKASKSKGKKVDIGPALEEFRETISQGLLQDKSEGAQTLRASLNLTNTYNNLKAKLERLQKNPDTSEIESLESQVNTTLSVFTFRKTELTKLLRKAKRKLENDTASTALTPNEHPESLPEDGNVIAPNQQSRDSEDTGMPINMVSDTGTPETSNDGEYGSDVGF